MKTKIINFLRIFTPLILGSLVGLIIKGSIDYNTLEKPPLSPPSITFPIAWAIIYLLLGISYYIFRKKSDDKNTIIIYYTELIVNLLWSIIFFTLKLRLLSILWILLLLLLVIFLLKNLKKISNTSFILNIPYLLWIIFATYLNIGIYILN